MHHLDLSSLKRINATPVVASNDNSPALDRLYIFEGLDASVRESIMSRCSKESFDAGYTIINEGDPSNGKAYIILSGSVEVSICGQVVSTLSQGDIFGEYALICAEDRTATIRTIESTECLVLDEDTLISVSNENNQINDIMIARINANTHQDTSLEMAA